MSLTERCLLAACTTSVPLPLRNSLRHCFWIWSSISLRVSLSSPACGSHKSSPRLLGFFLSEQLLTNGVFVVFLQLQKTQVFGNARIVCASRNFFFCCSQDIPLLGASDHRCSFVHSLLVGVSPSSYRQSCQNSIILIISATPTTCHAVNYEHSIDLTGTVAHRTLTREEPQNRNLGGDAQNNRWD